MSWPGVRQQLAFKMSARIDSTKPFAKHLPLTKHALNECKTLNLSAECKTDLQGIIHHLSTFKCFLLTLEIKYCKQETRLEVANIKSLLDEMKALRNQWNKLLSEAKLVADNISSDLLCESGLAERFHTPRKVNNMFKCLWNYQQLSEQEIESLCSVLQATYPNYLNLELGEELKYLKSIHESNLGSMKLKPLQLLYRLNLFPNVCIAIRVFCSIPVTVAEAERTFSKMKLIKNIPRSTMNQERMTALTFGN
ncbi:hypothetical protein PR048_025254 [Dryococelus australis]|uniref:HAT C-terminal dimerisation domain-containing protein n=1 Tax=Dryococelus australis TaxID=614101 RepID=A0ABQ9GQS5_9NEOP|nr:hypothetical protein PR048_025254 [Dryococelus australis]